MKLFERNAVTLATWPPDEPTHRVRYKIVRIATKDGMTWLDWEISHRGEDPGQHMTDLRWKHVLEGTDRVFAIVGNTDTMGDFLVSSVRYNPQDTKWFTIEGQKTRNGKGKPWTDGRIQRIYSAWHDFFGQKEGVVSAFSSRALQATAKRVHRENPDSGKLFNRHIRDLPKLPAPILKYDAMAYDLLGVERPWMKPHEEFIEWLGAQNE